MLKSVSFIATLLAIACTVSSPAHAAAADTPRKVDVPAGELATALQELAKQSGVEFVYSPDQLKGIHTGGVQGEHTTEDAVSKLLEGTKLQLTAHASGALLIALPASEAGRQAASEYQTADTGAEETLRGGDGPARLARLADEGAGNSAASAAAGAGEDREGSKKADDPARSNVPHRVELEEVVVTGSHIIQDPGKLTRQVLTITRQELEDSGFTRLDEYLEQLPQNINSANNVGAGTSFVGSGISFGRGRNVYAGSGINLRGLGEQYTLVLIDGRRPARGGLFGDVVDISTIPVARVERIEILFDGAAALYGADAIGGVVNIITRRDYEGTQLGFTLSRPEDGGGEQIAVDIGRTFRLGEGSITVGATYQTEEPIDGAERPRLRLGRIPVDGRGFLLSRDGGLTLHPSVPGNVGTGFGQNRDSFSVGQENSVLMWVRDVDGDGRTTNQALDERLPGGVFIGNHEATGLSEYEDREPPPGYVPVHTLQLPQSFPGAQLSLYDIPENAAAPLPSATDSETQILAAMRARFPLGADSYVPGQGFSLSPKDDTVTLSVSVDQPFSERLRARLTANYARAERDFSTRNDTHLQGISRGTAVNPFGVDLFSAFTDDLPQTEQRTTTDTASLSGGLDYDFSSNWRARLGFGLSESQSESNQHNQVNLDALAVSLNGFSFDDDGRALFNERGFTRPLLGYPDADSYIAALTLPRLHTRTDTSSVDVDLRVDGLLATLPAGEARTSIVVARMRDTVDVYSEQFADEVFEQAKLPPGALADARTSRGQSGVGVELSVPLLKPLLANVNARRERYDGVEDHELNWSTGLNWTVTDWMTFRANRTYNVRLPTSVLMNAETRVFPLRLTRFDEDGNPTLPVFDPDNPGAFDPLSILRDAYFIVGGNGSLVPEENTNVSLGAVFRLSDAFDLDVNYSRFEVRGQLGVPALNTNVLPSQLTPEALAANPLLSIVENGSLVVDGVTLTESSLTANHAPAPLINGAVVLDQREFNLGDVRSHGIDLGLSYRQATSIGQWFIRYTHQYILEHELRQNPLCVDGVCQDLPSEEWVNVVAQAAAAGAVGSRFSPVPRHRGHLSISWEKRGLSAHVQTSMESDTTVSTQETFDFLNEDGDIESRTNSYRVTTHPETAVHFGVGYDFGGGLLNVPSWMRTTQLDLQISNLLYSERKLTRKVIVQEFEPREFRENEEFNPYGQDPYGRRYQLSFRTSF